MPKRAKQTPAPPATTGATSPERLALPPRDSKPAKPGRPRGTHKLELEGRRKAVLVDAGPAKPMPGPTPAPAQEPAERFDPKLLVNLTALLLGMVGTRLGAPPTADQVQAVNKSAAAVLDKYRVASRWGPELTLAAALGLTVMDMQMRGEKARAKADGESRSARGARDNWPQGQRQEQPSASSPRENTALAVD